jgi:hypothetical protein
MAAKVAQATELLDAISRLPDAHVAYALLRYCASFPALQFALRTSGPAPALVDFDAGVLRTLRRIVGPLSPAAATQATLPLRQGGLALRPTVDHAPGAYIVAASDALRYASQLVGSEGILGPDPVLEAALHDPALTQHPAAALLAESYLANGVFIEGSQRRISAAIDDRVALRLRESLPVGDRARLSSCGAPHASGWLTAPPIPAFGQWFAPASFVALVRFRLGVDVSPHLSSCVLCGDVVADTTGYHATTCMAGGEKSIVHRGIAKTLFALASHALCCPAQESRPFTDTGLRCDVELRDAPDGGHVAIDVAVTNPCQPKFEAAAADTPGAAASLYEAVKWAKYGPFVVAPLRFVPVIFETYGAVGQSGLPLLRGVAEAWGRRCGLRADQAVSLFMQRLSCCLQHGIAHSLLRSDPTTASFGCDLPVPDAGFAAEDH